jgi:nucleoside-diphosphate-sugar epimerase
MTDHNGQEIAMTTHLIVGAGPVGTSTARQLVEAGHHVRLVTRSGSGPEHPAIERITLDATDAEGLARVAKGAEAIYNCVNPPYRRWATMWPPIAAALLHAAECSGAVLATTSNLYAYGPVSAPMTEGTPMRATGTKGRVRAQMWRDALAAHEAGRVRATEVRASDFYGPDVVNAMLGERALRRMLDGKSVQLLGNVDALHSVTYVPDVARLLITVASDERAWGRAWHAPTAPALTQGDTVRAIAQAAGVPEPKVVAAPRAVLTLAGLVVSTVRELRETLHQFEHDWVLDSSLAERTFGLAPTALADGARATIAALRGASEDAVAA